MNTIQSRQPGFRLTDAAKFALDVTAAAIALVALSPIFLMAAAAIKIGSNGPVFYRGLRTGLDGRPFKMLKFRTMVADAERLGGPSTGKNDARVTRVGRFLRRYKLDELPQLINVMRGEMSIVGPRPEVPEYTRLYSGDELLILTVRPGITDYSSIRFRNLDEVLGDQEPDRVYEERVRPVKNLLRVQYVRERSFFGDLVIIARTIYCIVFNSRAV